MEVKSIKKPKSQSALDVRNELVKLESMIDELLICKSNSEDVVDRGLITNQLKGMKIYAEFLDLRFSYLNNKENKN